MNRRPTDIQAQLRHAAYNLEQLEALLSPEELIEFLEPYITAAQGRIIRREDESGRRGETKYHANEKYE